MMRTLREKIEQERAIAYLLLRLLGVPVPVFASVLFAAQERVKLGSK
jgi:hypothetical protein